MATETTPQGQRKRTLEALERRFAVAEAQLLQQQGKYKRKNNEANERESSGPVVSDSYSRQSINTSLAPHLSTPSIKDAEARGPAYAQLTHSIHESLQGMDVKTDNRKGSRVGNILHELLLHGDSSVKYQKGHKGKQIDKMILLDNYVRGRCFSTGSSVRAQQKQSKRSKIRMSIKQHKKLGSFNLPQDLQKYESFKPMHEMWKSYIKQLLKKNQSTEQCLLSADLHGAIIQVVWCEVTSFNGVRGIMIRETAETLGIVTENDKFRVVPKKLSVFQVLVDIWKVTLVGDKLTSRNSGL